MDGGKDLFPFKRRLLVLPPLLIAAVNLPMALGLIPPNRLYRFRSAATLGSDEAWYSSNFWAGITGVVLGIAGALVVQVMLRRGPLDVGRAVMAGGVAVLVAFASLAAGLLAS
jgi:uncharacterized membrane protein